MKRLCVTRLFASMVIGFLFMVSQTWADTVYTFGDSWIDWPGYTSNHSKKDEYGTPKIDNMRVTLDDEGILQTVDMELHGSTNWLDFNSLFINSYGLNSNNSQWDDWDYFAHDGGSDNTGYTWGTVPGDGLYRVDPGGYKYTKTKNQGPVRRKTPNGIDDAFLTLVNNDNGRGWERSVIDPYLLSYSFADIGIDLSDGFFIAFAPYCSNDVIGGSMNPVPEPGTMALLSLGLLGLAGFCRKRSM